MGLSSVKRSKEERKRQILALLYLKPQTQSSIKEKLNLSKSWISEIVNEMVKEGLVKKKRVHRGVLLELTDKGLRALRESVIDPDIMRNVIEKVLRDLKLDFERGVHDRGLSFDYLVKNCNLRIRIIRGVMIPEELETLLDNQLVEQMKSIEQEFSQAILDIADQKGILMSIIHEAVVNKESKYILIIHGMHPEKWPEKLMSKIGEFLKEREFTLLKEVKERLIYALKNLPENLIVLHADEINVAGFEETLLRQISLICRGNT